MIQQLKILRFDLKFKYALRLCAAATWCLHPDCKGRWQPFEILLKFALVTDLIQRKK